MKTVDNKENVFLEHSFVHLPGYARFLLDHGLDRFVQKVVMNALEINIPLLRFFSAYSEAELISISTDSNRRLLGAIADNEITSYLERAKRNWLENQLPVVSRDQVLAEDITLISFVRRKVFREMLAEYAESSGMAMSIMEEVDRLTVIIDSTFMNAFIRLQQTRIDEANFALQKREQQLIDAQTIGKIGGFEWDFSGNETRSSAEMDTIFEIDASRLTLDTFMQFVHPGDREKVRLALEQSMISGEYYCEYRYARGDREKYILSRGKVSFDNGKPVRMVGMVMDITEKQAIIKKLEESELLSKQAQALTHIGNWSLDPATGEMQWSDELYRIFGLEPQREKITLESLQSFFRSDQGKRIVAGLRYAARAGKVPEGHFRISRRDGGAKIIRGNGEVVRDKNGKVIRIIGTAQDVTTEFLLTERLKERERYLDTLNRSLAQKNEQLVHKNKELESFNFIASHDLQEPLRKIQIYSHRIMESELPAETLADFERMRKAAGRMQKLIDDFLAFSQTISLPRIFESTDLNVVVDEARQELLTRIAEKGARIHCRDLPVIQGVAFQMKQLFINLISNSLKYAHPERVPEISIEAVANQRTDAGARVVIRYRDNGIGFEQKYGEKIFELFQRLHNKNQYSGTGIGLALCRKICENHNGTITAAGEPMQGATFSIDLPLVAE